MNPDDILRKVMGDLAKDAMRAEAERAKADPLGHKLTRVMADGLHYRYYATTNGRGQEVRFAWSTKRNVAGFYLGWREVVSKTKVKRDRWLSRRVKKRVIEIARRRHRAAFARRVTR